MGARLVGGIAGFILIVFIIQSYVLGGDDSGLGDTTRSGVVPTATLPAQLPQPVDLGAVQAGNPTTDVGSTGTTGGGTYIVQEGDTLGSIAASFNVAPAAQAAWIAEVLDLNGIADARLLQAGQELMVPEAPAAASTPGVSGGPGAVVTATPEVSGGGEAVYIVVSGDSPFGIAEKFCVESPVAWVNELTALNGLDPNSLAVGQELQLPAGTPPQCLQ